MTNTSAALDSVILGDCVEVMNALPERSVDLVFADPPYYLRLDGDLWRPNETKVDATDDAWDRFSSPEDYDAFTREWLSAARRVMSDRASLWVIGSYHNIYRVGKILMDLGFWILNDIVWIKTNPTPQMRGVRFCNAHETLLWVKKSQAATKTTFNYRGAKAGNEDRQMRSDWYMPICQGGERIHVEGLKAHSTQKPEALLHRIISTTSNAGDLVLDPFCGTGTTAAVAKRLGRRFITIDRDPGYVEIAQRRVDAETPLPTDQADTPIGDPIPKVPFATLVEHGLAPAGARLQLIKGSASALINADGTVTANGYRGSIHRVGARCLETPACNGWTAWALVDPSTGAGRLLDEIRREFAIRMQKSQAG
jgi:modification methylase